MNEQIKELLLQADIQFDKDINEIDVCVLLPSDLEKFAELIIQECMACSTWVGKVNENVKEPGPMHTAHAINQRIKKHFGVEE